MKPHIRLSPDKRFQRVLVCGAPERAALIAEYLDQPTPLEKNREYHSYVGRFQGKDILVVSHGVGAAGATICFQELIDVGARAIIRVGTAGGLQDNSKIGDIVIASGTVRNEGVTPQMVPVAYPALPDLELTSSLVRTFSEMKAPHTVGVVLTSDLFYPALLDPTWELYQRARVVAVEMECSALFITGQLRDVKTAAVLALDGNPLKWKDGMYDPNSAGLDAAIRTSISASLKALAEQEIS